MDLIQINLLPKEVLEKRKSEHRLALALLGLIGMVLILCTIYGLNMVRVVQAQSSLEEVKTENNRLQTEIAKIGDFERIRLRVEERDALVKKVTATKYSWSRFLNNVSLIVPNEVWLSGLTVEDDGKISFTGKALAGSKISGVGHKPVAKWMVHLEQLDDIEDVWLTSSRKGDGGAVSSVGPTLPTVKAVDAPVVVDFETKAKIKSLGPNDPSDSSSQPPPVPEGKT